MVRKIRILIFIIIFTAICILAFNNSGNIETNLLKTLLPQNVINSSYVTNITNKTASTIKIVFESDNENNLEDLKNYFIKRLDNNYFELNKPEYSKLFEKYTKEPTNFLSYETRNFLKEKEFDTVYSKSLERLYNPTGIQLTAMDKDPYLLFDDYISVNKKYNPALNNIDQKYYDYISLKIRTNDGLSPESCNKEISKIIKLKEELSNKNNKIYMAGSPIHSYYTSKKSIIAINIICLLSTIMIIFLTYYHFKNLKLLIPIAISISFGMLSGYAVTKTLFNDFQIITMVFSTTLIGIGIDYSYHYFFSQKSNGLFFKNLTLSLITTIIPFVLLYYTGIELLKQMAVFTIFGLSAIYLTVILLYPNFKTYNPKKTMHLTPKFYKTALIILCCFSILGLFRLHFNDTLTALYSPSKELQTAEDLYNKVSGNINKNPQIIIIQDDNLQKILEKEESITDNLQSKNIEYIALSKFIPSIKRQNENYRLVKDLYENNLIKYSDILSLEQINYLKNSQFTPIVLNIEDYPYLKDFMLSKNESMIMVFSDIPIINTGSEKIINIQTDIKNYMEQYRKVLMSIIPIVLCILMLLLSLLYKFKNACKIVLPPVLGMIGAICISSLICGEINLFSIISLFLILGFTMDYSIFRINSENQTENAILISCITTTFSFLLLSLCGFKLLSSIALILFFGILVSYITGYYMLKAKEK